jgi:glycosyltransferase involved in cell wall biosynthesis
MRLIKFYSTPIYFLLPSENRKLWISSFRSTAWSVPVISSNSGGLPSKFDGISGYWYVGNIDEMAENVKIITDIVKHLKPLKQMLYLLRKTI